MGQLHYRKDAFKVSQSEPPVRLRASASPGLVKCVRAGEFYGTDRDSPRDPWKCHESTPYVSSPR